MRVEIYFNSFSCFLDCSIQFFVRWSNLRALFRSMRDWHRSSVGRWRTEYAAPLLFADKQFTHFILFIIVREVQSFVSCGRVYFLHGGVNEQSRAKCPCPYLRHRLHCNAFTYSYVRDSENPKIKYIYLLQDSAMGSIIFFYHYHYIIIERNSRNYNHYD